MEQVLKMNHESILILKIIEKKKFSLASNP